MRLFCLLAALALSGSPVLATQYRVVEVPRVPPYLDAFGLALNDSLEVVGNLQQAVGFRWTEAQGTRMVLPTWVRRVFEVASSVDDINAFGDMAGSMRASAPSYRRAAVFHRNGGYTLVPSPPPEQFINPRALAINDSGMVAVYADRVAVGPGRSYVWRPGGPLVELGGLTPEQDSYPYAINNNGTIVGRSAVDVGGGHIVSGAFRWTQRQGITLIPFLPGYSDSARAHDVNDRETVVGYCFSFTRSYRAFVWTPQSGTQDLGLPRNAIPYAINSVDQVVGEVLREGAFIRFSNGEFRMLQDLLVPGSPSYRLTGAVDVNSDGVILCIALDGSQVKTVMLFPMGL